MGIEAAVAQLERLPKHQATQSCISIADDRGRYAICELDGSKVDVAWGAQPPCHTNHYLGLGGAGAQSSVENPSSYGRYDRVAELLARKAGAALSLEDVKAILGDSDGVG